MNEEEHLDYELSLLTCHISSRLADLGYKYNMSLKDLLHLEIARLKDLETVYEKTAD